MKLVGIHRFIATMAINPTPNHSHTRRERGMAQRMRFTYRRLPSVSQRSMVRKTTFFGLLGSLGRRISAHMAGLRVSATTVEMSTDTAMVTVNCRYRMPVMPPRKLTGTNTAHSTSEVAMSAPVRPFIAFCVAWKASSFSSSMMRSTFSTTTMASSTTIPMERIRPRRVIRLREKPKMSMKPKVPTSEMGTAISGMSVARQFCRERYTTRITRNRASKRVLYTLWIEAEMYSVLSSGIS